MKNKQQNANSGLDCNDSNFENEQLSNTAQLLDSEKQKNADHTDQNQDSTYYTKAAAITSKDSQKTKRNNRT